MFKRAVKEVRYHPGRFWMVLVAIAISTGFIVATLVAVPTELGAVTKSRNAQYAKATLVVTRDWGSGPMSEKESQARNDYQTPAAGIFEKAFAEVPGLKAEAPRHGMLVLGRGEQTVIVTLTPVPNDARFRWFQVLEGRVPQAVNEVMLGRDAAATLGVKIGDKVEQNQAFGPGGEVSEPLVLVGLSDAPRAKMMDSLAVVSQAFFEKEFSQAGNPAISTWILGQDGDPELAKAAVAAALEKHGIKYMKVSTLGEFEREESRIGMAGGLDPFTVLGLVFGAISLLVGTIIIATTFSIIFTQRRRQIALLRLVGASGRQLRWQLFVEASIIGLIGSGLGVGVGIGAAYAAATWTGASYWNFVIPWVGVLVTVGIGTAATVLAAFIPAIRATRVAPIEALAAVPSAARAKQVSIFRGIFCALLIAVGIGLAWWALSFKFDPEARGGEEIPLLAGLGAGLTISLGVLFATPIFVPWLLRFFGLLVRPFGATARMAAANSVRNPGRSAATATALMLAIGLIITIQVSATTIKEAALAQIAKDHPVDLVVSGYTQGKPVPPNALASLKAVPGIKTTVPGVTGVLKTKEFEGEIVPTNPPEDAWLDVTVVKYDAALAAASRTALTEPKPGEVVMNRDNYLVRDPKGARSAKGELPYRKSIEFKDETGQVRDYRVVIGVTGQSFATIMHPSDFATAVPKPVSGVIWAQVTDRTEAPAIYGKLVETFGGLSNREVEISGALIQSAMLEQSVNMILLIVSGLLGVSVLIALLGVGNTLGLSVIERTRESALLRALGQQRSSLRWMLAIEALFLSLTGVLVGVAAGSLFAWLGVKIFMNLTPFSETFQLAVDWRITGTAILVTMLAGVASSVLPGRRAARATPVEALADVG